MIDNCIKMFKSLKSYITSRIMLFEMDWCFYFLKLSGCTLFPPSFYYTHTKEETDYIIKETINELRQIKEESE